MYNMISGSHKPNIQLKRAVHKLSVRYTARCNIINGRYDARRLKLTRMLSKDDFFHSSD